MRKPLIGISMGDPAGIGPEITRFALNECGHLAEFIVYGLPELYSSLPEITVRTVDGSEPIRQAIEDAAADLSAGVIDGVVTAPVNKAVFGGDFPGHTELFADRMGRERVVMMMAGPSLRVVPVTTHVPLAAVPGLLSVDLYVDTARTVFDALKHGFGVSEPRFALSGLNPHASDGGLFGTEEETILTPAVMALRELGFQVEGPISPDTVFVQAKAGRFDVVLCPYHDQALIPFKLLHFSDGVNVTLGLGRPRTSPDHGPAYDIAGKGVADPTSMVRAIEMCVQLSRST
jgi:4-hydroxythreonine-4-phosphate dehydrogenase